MNHEDKDSEKKQGERQDEEDQKEEEKNQIRYANWTRTFSPFSIRSSDGQFWSISASQWVDTKFEVTQSANHLTGPDAISMRRRARQWQGEESIASRQQELLRWCGDTKAGQVPVHEWEMKPSRLEALAWEDAFTWIVYRSHLFQKQIRSRHVRMAITT